MEETLSELRKKIDAIDEEIFALLLKRLKIVEEVGELKRANCTTTSIIRSGREAIMIKNIFDKAKAAGFEDKIAYGFANIWRNIICVSISIEQEVKIATHSERTALLAKDYLGNFLSTQNFGSPLEVLKSLKSGTTNLAVLESTGIEHDKKPWWLWLLENNEFKVFATIPFMANDYKNIFAIAKTEPENTNRDISLYVIDSVIDGSESIAEYMGKHLIAIKGYKPLGEENYIGSFAEKI